MKLRLSILTLTALLALSATAQDASRVLVPAGSFVMGDDGGAPGELPERTVAVDAFEIDRTEVSNADYEAFVAWVAEHGDAAVRHAEQADGKDHTPRYWKSFRPALLRSTGMADLQRFDDSTFRQPDHPVVGVDWFDAHAYCAWAGGRLPTEAEWEKAARGTGGATWPWGDEWTWERCNSGGYERAGERDGWTYSAPVGSYPTGASPYGALDMAGNVAEWTADTDGAEGAPAGAPVTNGGRSNRYPSGVRPAARASWEPTYRAFALGFRCVGGTP